MSRLSPSSWTAIIVDIDDDNKIVDVAHGEVVLRLDLSARGKQKTTDSLSDRLGGLENLPIEDK